MPYSSKCTGTQNQCNAQLDLYNSLTNPILANLIASQSRTDYDATKFGGIGWISIPTTANSGLDIPLSKLNATDTVINFLVIKVYSADECKLIFKNLDNGGDPASGQDIIFDNQGNIAINDNGKNNIMYNPIIPDNMRNVANLDATNSNNTIFGKCGSYMSQSDAKVYYISSRVLINPTLNYILYTKDATPSQNSIYYLLYNPIHREVFQDYYRSLIESTGNWEPSGVLLDPGSSKGYEDSDIIAYSDSGLTKVAPSFKTVISKYCNAFKILGDTLPNGQTSEHYADPSCNMALSSDDAGIAFILGANYTQATLARKYWAPLGDDSAGTKGYNGYKNAQASFASLPQSTSLYWPCPDQNPQQGASPYRFCHEISGVIGSNSDSFVNVLANAYVNSYGQTVVKVATPLNRGANGNKSMVQCIPTAKNIVTCQNIVNVGGSIDKSNLALSSACGVNPASKVKPSGTGTGDSTGTGTGDSTGTGTGDSTGTGTGAGTGTGTGTGSGTATGTGTGDSTGTGSGDSTGTGTGTGMGTGTGAGTGTGTGAGTKTQAMDPKMIALIIIIALIVLFLAFKYLV